MVHNLCHSSTPGLLHKGHWIFLKDIFFGPKMWAAKKNNVVVRIILSWYVFHLRSMPSRWAGCEWFICKNLRAAALMSLLHLIKTLWRAVCVCLYVWCGRVKLHKLAYVRYVSIWVNLYTWPQWNTQWFYVQVANTWFSRLGLQKGASKQTVVHPCHCLSLK